jgi:hypothetical protein
MNLAVQAALLDRVSAVIASEPKRDGDYAYGLSKTHPEAIAFRVGNLVEPTSPEDVQAGRFDIVIRDTYHERASVQYWYLYEKDYT